MTLAEALALARRLDVPRLDAQLLLAHLLQQPRSWLLAHDDAKLTASQSAELERLLRLRADAVPLAYLTGEREFHGLPLRVTPDVLVPRPDTETLVAWALERLPAAGAGGSPRVLDLGTGSGAIALALKHARPDLTLVATDASPAALAVAQGNGERLGLTIDWQCGSWWQAVPAGRFDLIVSNPPYIAEGDVHLPALRHEPIAALTAGADGLSDLRVIIAGAASHLGAGGWLMLEHGHDQADAVTQLLREAGLVEVQSRPDLAGTRRCSGGRLA